VETLESRRHFDVTVVMSGLDSPRGLSFGPQGALYVAEAGKGGDGPMVVRRGETLFYGASGAVSRLWHGKQERVATGLPSLALADGSSATGPHDVALAGAGNAYVTIGLGADPAFRDVLGDEIGPLFGRIARVKPNGKWRLEADIAGYEQAANPDPRVFDSNPYGILVEGGEQVITDAGGNSLLRVAANGDISTIGVIPTLPPGAAISNDPVPTCITVGPDGAYYVGILSGAPFRNGAANIYRIVPGEAPTIFLSGFKTILDIDFDDAGNLYVIQHSSGPAGLAGPGSLLRVAPDGTRTTVLGGLTRPTSVVVGPDQAIYVSDFGISPGIGRVLRITADPAPVSATHVGSSGAVNAPRTTLVASLFDASNDEEISG
jgi:sugar lactone lactonase YvrE